MKTQQKAFTLIELIIVIIILGILTGIAYLSYAAFATNSKDTAVEQTAQALARQVKALSALDQGGNPQDWHDYVAEAMTDINTATVEIRIADSSGWNGIEMPANGSIPDSVEESTIPPTAFTVTLDGRTACMIFLTPDASPTSNVSIETGADTDWAFDITGGCTFSD